MPYHGNRTISYSTTYAHPVEAAPKIDAAMRWLSDAEHPANFVMMYFDEPDYMGHVYSPDSNEVSKCGNGHHAIGMNYAIYPIAVEVIEHVQIVTHIIEPDHSPRFGVNAR